MYENVIYIEYIHRYLSEFLNTYMNIINIYISINKVFGFFRSLEGTLMKNHQVALADHISSRLIPAGRDLRIVNNYTQYFLFNEYSLL